MSFSSATDRRWPCSRAASFVWGAVVILLVCYLASSRYAPLALHSLIGASAASLGPLPVDALYQRHAAAARSRLFAGLDTSCEERACVFNDVVVSLPLPAPELLKKGNGDGQGAKAMLNPEGLFGKNHDTGCVVYGLGISVDSSFEVGMTEFCETHAFDCTIAKNSEAIVGKPPNFHFHQTCIGRQTGIKETSGYGGQTWDLVFKPLKTVMSELGHRKVDVMKFDIEGSEWELIAQDILDPANANPPQQLQFELHTKYANPAYVPPDTVGAKGKREVNQLFIELFDRGYRVISKELNSGDPACAEISLVLT